MAIGDIKQKIETANAEAVRRINAADPVLVDIAPAGEVIPGLKDRMILHSGPPVDWQHMCGAQRGAMIGIALYEGWAKSVDEAATASGERGDPFEPNHHHQAVGPMAGRSRPPCPSGSWKTGPLATGPSAGRWRGGSSSAITAMGLWKACASGGMSGRRRSERPSFRWAASSLKPIIAKALQMGDELHNRPVAASSLFANALAGPLVEAGVAKEDLLRTLGYITNHELIFLGLSMASGKATADPAAGIEYSTVVIAMARNGTEFGIRVSGLRDEWFTAPSPRVNGLYLPGYAEKTPGPIWGIQQSPRP